MAAELSDADEGVVAELKTLTGIAADAELIRAGLRALLREQRKLHAPEAPPPARVKAHNGTAA